MDARCALGGMYSAYMDLNDLIIHVNSTTLEALKQSLTQGEVKNISSTDRLHKLAQGYLKFAIAHRNLWKALFEHVLPEGSSSPQWHLDERLFLLSMIAEPLSELQPEMSAADRAVRA